MITNEALPCNYVYDSGYKCSTCDMTSYCIGSYKNTLGKLIKGNIMETELRIKNYTDFDRYDPDIYP